MGTAFIRAITIALTGVMILASNPTVAEQLNIAIVSRTVFYVPLWIAERQGYLRENGLEAKIVVYNNAEKINSDLRSRAVQIAISTPESVIIDAYNGGSLRIIGGNAEKLPHFIIVKPAIKTLSELKGAKIGVLSLKEGTTFLVQEVAKAAGLKPGDYTIEAVGGAPTRWKLLKQGKIDAGLQPFPLSYEAEAAGFNNLGPVASYVPNYQFTSINVDIRWAKQHAATVRSFMAAMRRGQEYAKANPDQAAAIAAQELKTTIELARRALQDSDRLKILSSDQSPSTKGLETAFKTLQAVGLIGKDLKFDMDRITDRSFLPR